MPDEMNGLCFSLPTRNPPEKADRHTFGGKAGKTIAATTSALYLAFPFALVKVSQESWDLDYLPVACLCQSSGLALFCSEQGSVSALPTLPVESFLLWICTNLPGHSNIGWNFFRSLTEFYSIAAVNFVSNSGMVGFSNLVFLKISLKPSVLISSIL